MAVTNGSKLSFEYEWEAAEGVTTPELRATWARLSIAIADDYLTLVEDATRSVRRSIYVPLYPLAEWLAYNWWQLRAHARPAYLPARLWSFRSRLRLPAHRSAWLTHHNLRGIGEGLPWPDLTLIPTNGTTIAAWQGDRTFVPGWNVRFLSSGRIDLDRGQVEEAFLRLIEAVLTRLSELNVHDTPLASEWRTLQTLDDEEVSFCAAAARLGLDPMASPPEVAEFVVTAAEKLSPSLLEDFLDAATPALLREELEWVESQWLWIRNSTHSTRPFPTTINRSSRPMLGWEAGLEDARRLRVALSTRATEPFDVLEWMSVEHVPAVGRALQGLGAHSLDGGRVVALALPRSSETERFAAARALWRFLRPSESPEFLLTTARTARQQAERAFAAELLAPADGIAAMIGPDEGQLVPAEDIRPVSEHYQVTDWVVEYQLINNLHREVEDPALDRSP